MKKFLAKIFGKPNQLSQAPRTETLKESADGNGPNVLLAVKPGGLLRQE